MVYLDAGTYYYLFGSKMEDRVIIPSPGVSVQVSYWSGSEYVDDTSSPMTAPGTVYTRQLRMRLISDGKFSFDNQEAQSVTD